MKKNTNTKKTPLHCGENIHYTKSLSLFRSALLILVVSSLTFSGRAALVDHGIAAGMVKVTNTSTDPTANVAATSLDFSINDFRTLTANRADYNVQIGFSRADDIATGFLMSCVTENVHNDYRD